MSRLMKAILVLVIVGFSIVIVMAVNPPLCVNEIVESGPNQSLALKWPEVSNAISIWVNGGRPYIAITCDGNEITVVFDECEPMDIFEMLHKSFCQDCNAVWKDKPVKWETLEYEDLGGIPLTFEQPRTTCAVNHGEGNSCPGYGP